jgi:Xaa-Pro dipeptidase
MRLDTVNSGVARTATDQLSALGHDPDQLPRRVPAFERSEIDQRLGRVREAIRKRDLAATLVLDQASVFYLTGAEVAASSFRCLAVPADGEPVLLVWDFELGQFALANPGQRVATYNWYEDSTARLAEVLRELDLEAETLGIEMRSASPGLLAALQADFPSARFVDSFGIVEDCRMRKSAAELAYMRAAAAITDQSVEVGFAEARVGATDSQIASAIMRFLYEAGSGEICCGPIVATGYNAGVGHASFTGRKLEPGDTVFLEYSAEVHHYVAPVMRTAVLGRPNAEQAAFRDAGLAAIDAVIETARPGVPAATVARAALDCLKPVRDKTYFHGLVAYSVGLGFPPTRYEHLGFELKESNDRLLEEGMAFHVVMSLRKFADFGVSQSHTVVVTDTGCEAITKSSSRLAELPA